MPICPQRPDKEQYRTEAEARRELRRMKKHPNRGQGLRRLAVYECPYCGYWHLGHYAPHVKASPVEPKQPTPGQQRRKAEREARKAERARIFEDWADTLRCVARMVEADIARLEAAAARARNSAG